MVLEEQAVKEEKEARERQRRLFEESNEKLKMEQMRMQAES